jgi:hypothetical protein
MGMNSVLKKRKKQKSKQEKQKKHKNKKQNFSSYPLGCVSIFWILKTEI